jgi:hypothetical protein
VSGLPATVREATSLIVPISKFKNPIFLHDFSNSSKYYIKKINFSDDTGNQNVITIVLVEGFPLFIDNG